MEKPHLILASQSPRRRDLLVESGYTFDIVVPSDSAECGMCSRETAAELVARYAFQKAKDVSPRVESGLILACDTVAECHGQILGKPKNAEHAAKMLKAMRGSEHFVLSGVCLWHRPSNRVLLEIESTTLVMDNISEAWINDYVQTDQWIGKAGAFGYQDGLDWVHVTQGSESNVVGLPMERLADMLERFDSEATQHSLTDS
ncbi:MAG: septum formation protein Maf [Planctomycetales bacterium]|nr:septum formation protein Maf [Planctomycetales bacterium]